MGDGPLVLRGEYFNGVEVRFENPNDWTEDEAFKAFLILNSEINCAFNIRYMALSNILKLYTASEWLSTRESKDEG